jgi:hypothetical protein
MTPTLFRSLKKLVEVQQAARLSLAPFQRLFLG